jgi:hypothetical protein
MRKKIKIINNQSIEELYQKAADKLANGYYKEAIQTYKQLLKKEPRQEWQQALAKAYLLRAQSLANKKMYKEAAVLWENRASLSAADQQGLDEYIYWLIQANRYIKAARIFIDSTDTLSNDVRRQLTIQFGALLLAGQPDIAETFPALLTESQLINEALTAYSKGNDENCEAYLKKIPFRSPYRDVRNIIKGLLIIETDPNAASQLLQKVPTSSPYAPLAHLIAMLGQHDDKTLLDALNQANSNERAFIAYLKGWDKSQLKLISMLQGAAKRDNEKALLEVVAANRQALGDKYSRQFCLALLPSYPAGVKIYQNIFGRLSSFEKNRITALSYERQRDFFKAEKYWRLAVENLKKTPQTDRTLKAALILRHIVVLIENRGEQFYDDTVPNDLIESINLNPEEKSSYIKLIQWYQHQKDKRSYHKWADTAAKKFPKDSEILLIGMESATQKKAFKKAVGFAKKLLKEDPINIKARQIARSSHIAHSRKLIKTGKYDLARKELIQAGQIEKNQSSGLVQINQGLLELQAEGSIKKAANLRARGRRTKVATVPDIFKLQKTKKAKVKNTQAIELLKEGLKLGGGGLCGFFRLIVETKSQAIDHAVILPLLPLLSKTYTPTRHEVLELLSLINSHSETGIPFLRTVLEPLDILLQKAVKIDFSKEERLNLCESFKKLEHYDLLQEFAVQALTRWKAEPAFVYYQLYGKANGTFWSLSKSDRTRIDKAFDKAEKDGDKRTSMMITKFINQQGGGFPSFFNNPFDIFGDDDDNEDDIAELMKKLQNSDDLHPIEMLQIIMRLRKLGINVPMPF